MKVLFNNKRGYFFSLDAFIALLVIIGVVIFIKPPLVQTNYSDTLHQDLLSSLSSLKIGELDNFYAYQWIADGSINNLNQSVLEQIGEFYALNETRATLLAQSILDDLNLNSNIGIYFSNNLIAMSGNFGTPERVSTARQLISGVEGGQAVKGYSSRAFLTSENRVDYFYFGGYVGDGNISVKIIGNVISASIEGVFSKPFNLSINGQPSGYYSPSSGIPYNISLTPYLGYFTSGVNYVNFTADGTMYIAGGFIKVVRNSSYYSNGDYYLPGINGLINLYSSFYVPSALNTMSAFIHYKSDYDIFMSIGNRTVYQGNSSGSDASIALDNAFFSSIFNYADLSRKTTPLRIGFVNASYFSNNTAIADVFSVTDISGSMCQCTDASGSCFYNQINCENPSICGAGEVCTGGIYEAKQANNILIQGILNSSNNTIGLNGYATSALDRDFHSLSIDEAALDSIVANNWKAVGSTCICCGINKAVEGFLDKLGMTAYYDFDNNTADKSSYGNTGTISGNPTYVSGVNNSALNFDGVGDYTSVADSDSIGNIGLDGLTFAMWIYPKRDAFYALGGTTNGFGGGGFNLYLRGGQANQEYSFGIDNRFVRAGNIDVNQWHHLAGTYDGAVMTLYLDGVSIRTGISKSGRIFSNSANGLYIGRILNAAPGIPDFNGTIDDVRIYRRALSQGEVSALADQTPSCGNGFLEAGEVCDGENSCTSLGKMGVKSCNQCESYNSCVIDTRYRVAVVMSDGEANFQCAQQGTGNAVQDAIQASCDAYNNYGIKTYSVGFGPAVDVITLQNISSCGNGNYYEGDVDEIVSIYQQISQDIITAAYYEQTLIGEGIESTLYPDSHITLGYDQSVPYGLVLTAETPIFNNSQSQGSFTVPNDATPYETRVVSYSGPRWTSRVDVYNSSSAIWNPVFDLGIYNSSFINLGDPYAVDVPINNIVHGNNTVRVFEGLGTTNYSAGSLYNKIIYTIIKNISSFSPIVASAQGCLWTIEFDDGTAANISVPSNYSGSGTCSYTSSNIAYNENDAIDWAVLNLLNSTDLDSDGKVDIKFTDAELNIDSSVIEGIPFTWESEVQVRTWR